MQHVLRPRSGARHAGQRRRGGRRDRGAEHRRARHPADHAHLPHRRRGAVAGRALARRGDRRRHRAAAQSQPGDRQQAAPGGARPHHRAVLHDESGREKARHRLPYGARLLVAPDAQVEKGARLAEWDPHTLPIIAEASGQAVFMDMVEGVTFREVVDEATGRASKEVVDWRQQTRGGSLRPSIVLQDEDGEPVKLASGAEGPLLPPGRRDPQHRERRRDPRRRRARASAQGGEQDPRHHRRSAAGGRAVRARRPKDPALMAEVGGPGRVRQGLQGQAAPAHRAARGRRRAGGVPDPQGTPRDRAGGRHRGAGRSSWSTATRCRTTSCGSRASRRWPASWSTRSRRCTACRA